MDRRRDVQPLPGSAAAMRARILTTVIGVGLLVLLSGCGGDRHATLGQSTSADVVADVLTVSTFSEASSSPTMRDPALIGLPADSAAEPASSTAPEAAPQVATLRGLVTRSGQPAAGVRLTLVAGDGTERITTSDGPGAYQFSAVVPGPYELIANAESGATCDSAGCISASWSERVEVAVAAGETRRVDVDGN